MARSKPDNVFPVKDLAAANAALGEIAGIKRSLKEIEASLNERIDRLKAESEVLAAPLQAQLKSLEAGLQAFAEFMKTELFKEKRSRELGFGAIGYRKSKEIKPQPKHTWAMVLGRLKEMGFTDAVRTKEEVDKEILQQWPDERLELVGARRVEKDAFWYEISEQEIVDLAN